MMYRRQGCGTSAVSTVPSQNASGRPRTPWAFRVTIFRGVTAAGEHSQYLALPWAGGPFRTFVPADVHMTRMLDFLWW